MKNNAKIGIYTWKLDGIYKYVGQSSNIDKRMFQKHQECDILSKAVKKYGYDFFEKEIVCYCKEEELSDLEIYYIRELRTHVSEGGYNVSLGGDAPMRGRKHSSKTKKWLSENSPKIWLGKSFSNEHKERIRQNRPDMSSENNPMYGEHHSEETKEKISISHKGKKKNGSSSKYFGVWRDKYKTYIYWRVRIGCDNICTCHTEIDAALAYDNYVIEHNLNRPLNFS